MIFLFLSYLVFRRKHTSLKEIWQNTFLRHFFFFLMSKQIIGIRDPKTLDSFSTRSTNFGTVTCLKVAFQTACDP